MAGSDADVARRIEVPEASEDAGLIGDAARPRTEARRGRWVALGLSGLALAGVALRKAMAPCQVAPPVNLFDQALVSLAEAPPEDLTDLLGKAGDRSAPRQWLTQRAQAGEDVEFVGTMDEKQALQKAMSAVKDPEHARTVLHRALKRSVGKWHLKRKGLKQHLAAQSSGLLRAKLPQPPEQGPRPAECVFNVRRATDQVAALAANINEAAKACAKAEDSSGKSCTADIGAILSSVSTIAGALSMATDHCAETMVPNGNALCAGAVSGIVANVAQLSGSTALVAEACDPKGIFEDTVASNFRSSQPLHTQCGISVNSVAWWLAQVGLAINAAVDPKAAASCDLKEGLPTLCTVDVSGAIGAFGEAVDYLKAAAAHCSDQFDVKAMCGAGINTTLSTFAGVKASSASLPIACHDYQGEEAASHFAGVVASSFGQRPLTASADKKLAVLHESFSSPEQAWKSIGYDLDDQLAGFRTTRPYRPATKDVVGLMEDSQPVDSAAAAAKSGGLFGNAQVCS